MILICTGGGFRVTRVLLFTASFGDGHNQAAYAVREALQARGVTVKLVDYVDWLNPAIRSFAKFSLMQGVQRVPTLYGLFYKSMSRIEPTSPLQRQLNHLGMSKMRRCIQVFKPDAIVSTFPTPTGVVSELRIEGAIDVPNLAVVTDYTAHRQWVNEQTDRYFVASESVQSELLSFGLQSKLVDVTGIPIRSKFRDVHVTSLLKRREELRKTEGFVPKRPVVLLMGGGGGVLGDVSEWESCMMSTDAQFVIVCGRNERLYRKFESFSSDRVRVLGFTQEIDHWMAMSDVLITKPGGLTVTESLAMELPMVLFRPIPGQEERNASYLLKAGAAVLAEDVAGATQWLHSFSQNPQQLSTMRAAAKRHAVRDSNERIASTIQDIAESYRFHHQTTSAYQSL
jgi:processive 1,2-diacylglycerol beta-glucosyltransferase